MEFDVVWNRIIKNAGEKFYTVGRKIEFVYSIKGDIIQPMPANGSKIQAISKNTIMDVLEKYVPLKSTTQLNDKYRAPSYIYAIMTDKRIV